MCSSTDSHHQWKRAGGCRMGGAQARPAETRSRPSWWWSPCRRRPSRRTHATGAQARPAALRSRQQPPPLLNAGEGGQPPPLPQGNRRGLCLKAVK